jgi:hypothetical protein
MLVLSSVPCHLAAQCPTKLPTGIMHWNIALMGIWQLLFIILLCPCIYPSKTGRDVGYGHKHEYEHKVTCCHSPRTHHPQYTDAHISICCMAARSQWATRPLLYVAIATETPSFTYGAWHRNKSCVVYCRLKMQGRQADVAWNDDCISLSCGLFMKLGCLPIQMFLVCNHDSRGPVTSDEPHARNVSYTTYASL